VEQKSQQQQSAIRVSVFDSTRLGCQLMAHALESSPYGIRVVAQSMEAVIEGASLLEDTDVAVIATELSEDTNSGWRLLQSVAKTAPSVRSIVLLDGCRYEQVVEAFRHGAMGVCGRNESIEVLSKCVDCVHRGQIWASSEQLRQVLSSFASSTHARLMDQRGNILLTRREEDIVILVAEGLRNKEVAERLSLSEHTIRNHLFKVFDKLGISSRSELILYSLEQRRQRAFRQGV
jgi:DNA-binding NarL/FixJ family response regulator